MALEPHLEPLSGEVLKGRSAIRAVDAKSDLRGNGFFDVKRNAFFEFRVFNPNALSYDKKTPEFYIRNLRMRDRVNTNSVSMKWIVQILSQ